MQQVTRFVLECSGYRNVNLHVMIEATGDHVIHQLDTKIHALMQMIMLATSDKTLTTPYRWQREITRLINRGWYTVPNLAIGRPTGKQCVRLRLENREIIFMHPSELDAAIKTAQGKKWGEIDIDEVLGFVLE